MELQTSIFEKRPAGAVADDVIPLCEFAKGLEEGGEFLEAKEVLQPFWSGPIARPNLRGLTERAQAELLLRAGTLTGWLGSAEQIPGAQEAAKDLISESLALFESLALEEKSAEARVDLAICYYREGALDEARVTLKHVVESLKDKQTEQRLRALLNIAIVEKVATRDHEALRIYTDAAPLFDQSTNHALKGKFHNSHATCLRSVGLSENREEYVDKALVEYAAASFHFEQAGHQRFQARVENNVGFLFASIGRFSEAHDHLIRARALLVNVGDHGSVALADDARAQAFLLEGKNEEAEKAARVAVQALKRGGEQTVLAEALTTYGKALARTGQSVAAKTNLDQAIEIAHRAGDPDRGGVAAVTAIEELSSGLTADTMQEYYRTAEQLLSNSQNRTIKTRLGECARRVLQVAFETSESVLQLDVAQPLPQVCIGPGFSLDSEVLRYEGSLIKQALETSDGSVTRAARMLGVTHQGLAFILNGRHNDLLAIRTPVKRRRRSIIKYR